MIGDLRKGAALRAVRRRYLSKLSNIAQQPALVISFICRTFVYYAEHSTHARGCHFCLHFHRALGLLGSRHGFAFFITMRYPSAVMYLLLLLAHTQNAASFSSSQHSHLREFDYEGIVYQHFRQLRTHWPYLTFTEILYKSNAGDVKDPGVLRVHLQLYDPDSKEAFATAAYYAEPNRWTEPTKYHLIPSRDSRWLPEEAPQFSIGRALFLLELRGMVGPWDEVRVSKPERLAEEVSHGFVYDFFREGTLNVRLDGWNGNQVWPPRDQAHGIIEVGYSKNVTRFQTFSRDGLMKWNTSANTVI